MIRYILILTIILTALGMGLWKACAPEDLHERVDSALGIHEDEHWRYVPCNGHTPKCGRLE